MISMEAQFSLTYSNSNTYMYDRNGNRLEEIRKMSDELDETLQREANGTLVHDISPTSNRLLGVDKGNSSISDLTYDDIGNVAVIFRTINGIQVQQDFTYGNALVPMLPTEIHQHAQFESDDPNQELEVIETFSYDFSGARISRTLTVYEMPEGASKPDEVVTTTYYLPSGTENLAELDQYGRVSRAYQFAGGERIGYKSKRIHARYVKDHLGSTRQTIALNLWKTQDPMNVPQSAAGDRSLNQAMRYAQADSGPFGLSTREAANSGANFEPHRFTGQELEPQIGLYYMGARFYDPDLGRFLQVDPVRQYFNSYSYGGNNPVMGIDPDGRFFGAFSGATIAANNASVAHFRYELMGELGMLRQQNALDLIAMDMNRIVDEVGVGVIGIRNSVEHVSNSLGAVMKEIQLTAPEILPSLLPAGDVVDISLKAAFLDAGAEAGAQYVHWFSSSIYGNEYVEPMSLYVYDTLSSNESYFGNSTTGIFGGTLGGGVSKGLFWMSPSLRREIKTRFRGDPTSTYTKVFPEINYGPLSVFWGGGYFGIMLGAPGDIGAHVSKPYYRKVPYFSN